MLIRALPFLTTAIKMIALRRRKDARKAAVFTTDLEPRDRFTSTFEPAA